MNIKIPSIGDIKMSGHDSIYKVKVSAPSDLSQTDISKCIDIISRGGAAGNSIPQLLPKAQSLVIARTCIKGNIVGVGALKIVRPEYAEEISGKDKSNFPFNINTTELGFIAIDPSYQNKGISRSIVEKLCSIHKGSLFATTDNIYIKKILKLFEFEQQGKEWKGHRGILSLWIKP
ncbi:MAG: GNAT family N-acetyltransferase [Alphaproteobacteria bacterium]|nr:GNAT family N-acetyltransferase [Alphaproteobacteria bacterium]